MILGFDFLGFQAIKRFPTKNRIFLHVMQSTITKNSFLHVFYSYVLVFYPYVTGMYLVCTRMLLVCTRMYSYVTRIYLYVTRMHWCGVLVTIRHVTEREQTRKNVCGLCLIANSCTRVKTHNLFRVDKNSLEQCCAAHIVHCYQQYCSTLLH